MAARNSAFAYGWVAKGLHWLVFVLLLVQFSLIFIAEELPDGDLKSLLITYHQSVGMTLLMVMALRLLWKLANPRPALPGDMQAWERRLANGVHWLFYVMVIAMPLVGWIMSSAGGHETPYFGLFTFPHLIGENEEFGEALEEIHETAGIVLLIVIGLHVLAGLRHHFVRKDDVLRRMLPIKQ